MNYVEKLLTRSERIVFVARDHWITLLPVFLIDLAVSVVIVGLSVLGAKLSPPLPWFGLLLLVIPVVHLALRLWAWWSKQMILTNRRIVYVTGTFNKKVSDTLLEKVNDIVTEQSAWGRFLKFGDIEIISGSESGIDVFRRLAYPLEFKKALFEQKNALGTLAALNERAERALDAEALSANDIPALIAGLDELRQNGLITDAEFEEKKQRLLAKI